MRSAFTNAWPSPWTKRLLATLPYIDFVLSVITFLALIVVNAPALSKSRQQFVLQVQALSCRTVQGHRPIEGRALDLQSVFAARPVMQWHRWALRWSGAAAAVSDALLVDS